MKTTSPTLLPPLHPQLVSILRQFNPTAYMNGHDHTLALAKDALNQSASTLYLTSGAG